MNEQALAARIRQASKLKGSFKLRSGAVSDTYFDKYLFESDPALLKSITEGMAKLLPADTEVLCGLEMGGIPVVAVLSQVTGLPAAFIRKERKAYGTEKFAEGPDLVGKRIVLIEDVVSSGGAIVDYARMLRDDGVDVDLAVCVIDRRPQDSTVLADAGIELRGLLSMAQIDEA